MLTKRPVLNPVSVSASYAVFATFWIWMSDAVILHLNAPARTTFIFATIKGTLFVVITMSGLYLLLRGMVAQIETIKKEENAKLRESQQTFSTAFESNPEGMTISSLDEGRYIEANESFLQMLGYSKHEIIGRRVADIGIWNDVSQRSVLIESILRGTSVRNYPTSFVTRDGATLSVEISAERIYLQGKLYLLAITRDITKQRTLERQFQQAQRMEALGQLAANVAHDFKNHLMVISGNAELLIGANDGDRSRRAAILKAAGKCDCLSRQLLAYSRKQELQPRPLSLSKAVCDCTSVMESVFGRNVSTATKLDSEWEIVADPAQLDQLVMNLAVNARDAMPNGGAFQIETSDVAIDSGHDGVPVPKGEYVQLAVSDTGVGISEDIRSKIFEPFFTTKERDKGTGLGLAAVYGIVKQSGGFIFVESEVGHGATFKMLFPRLVSQASATV